MPQSDGRSLAAQIHRERSAVTCKSVHETADYTVAVFFLEKPGAAIPLHDHPNMAVRRHRRRARFMTGLPFGGPGPAPLDNTARPRRQVYSRLLAGELHVESFDWCDFGDSARRLPLFRRWPVPKRAAATRPGPTNPCSPRIPPVRVRPAAYDGRARAAVLVRDVTLSAPADFSLLASSGGNLHTFRAVSPCAVRCGGRVVADRRTCPGSTASAAPGGSLLSWSAAG